MIGKRIKELRKEKGLKQSEIAEILGVSVQSYSAYENGREPNYATLCSIAKYYKVTTDYLLGLTDFKNPQNANIGEITGLSDKAISNIEQWNREGIPLNALLINKYFKKVLMLLNTFENEA